MIMETSTLNLILGMGFGLVSFAFAFKWIVNSIIDYKLTTKNSHIINMTAEEFQKMVEKEYEDQ